MDLDDLLISSRLSTTPPSRAFAPPDNPVPAPRATTGARCWWQTCTTACASWAERARTTAAGLP
nr:hypothetical protein [Arsenicicoccus piscis]